MHVRFFLRAMPGFPLHQFKSFLNQFVFNFDMQCVWNLKILLKRMQKYKKQKKSVRVRDQVRLQG